MASSVRVIKLVLSMAALVMLLLCSTTAATSNAKETQQNVFILDNYGARGDGQHDDTQALAKAWNMACSSSRPAVLLVPKGKSYLLKPIALSGPCKSTVTLTVEGTLVAPASRSAWSEDNISRWIVIQGVTGLTVTGGGTINGNGDIWWKNSCKTNKALPCTTAPTALSFHRCNNLKVDNMKIVNSQQIHVSVEDCTNVQLARLSITAPSTSPNTDGIHITRSTDVQVRDCVIKTGDDCISIEDGTHNLLVTKVVCGPGHGISIGSLGDDNSRAEVSGITVDSVQLYGTTNGVRIKTWQGGSGYAKGITFQNIIMDKVQNPVIIDQNYCDSAKPCKKQESAVEISNVVFTDVFHVLSGMWKTPAERCFLWLGGFRPSELLKLLSTQLEPLTEQQLSGICNLQQSSQQAEDALSQGMEALQQSLAETLAGSIGSSGSTGNVANYMGQMAMAMGKLGTLENFLRQADNLRQQTLQQMQRILTTRQSARAFLVISDYSSRLRALSSLWLARPKE